MRNFRYIAALCVAGTLAPAAALAQREARASDFPLCDGYTAPGRNTDGITRGVSGFAAAMIGGTSSSQLRREEPRYGAQGVTLCTALLTHSRLLPEYRLRRASLLEARGLHRLASNDATGALADFDLAREAAGSGDALTERSFLLGLRLVRAYAQLKAGNSSEAARESLAVLAARPYDTSFAQTAAQLHFAAARDWPAYLRNLREIARADPNVITILYTLAFYRGEFDEMIALHPQVILGTPRAPTGGYEIPGRNQALAEAVARRAVLDGAYAYALQARGRNADADAALAAARRTVAEAMTPPTPPTGRERPTRAQRDLHEAMLAQRPAADGMLDATERMIRLRRMVADNNVEGVVAELESRRIDPDPAALDLFEAMSRARPALGTEMSGMMGRLRVRLATEVDRAVDLSLQELADRLPEPESPQRMPSYDGGAGLLDGDGYTTSAGTLPGAQVIRFSSAKGSISIANELALLRAAQLARQGGHRGLVVLRRRGVIRTMTVTTYGYRSPPTPSGQEAEIEVVFVDPAALPASYGNAGWRVLDPDAIWTMLSPVYLRGRETPARPAAN